MTVTVKKLGGSVAVVIPKGVAREMELLEGTPLEISATGDAIVMRKQAVRRRARRPIAELVKKIKPSAYKRRNKEQAERGPLGREMW
jgi:antitoxin component of MazEF toxin-antitoxin module